jgi:hypothetical protein
MNLVNKSTNELLIVLIEEVRNVYDLLDKNSKLNEERCLTIMKKYEEIKLLCEKEQK